MRYEFVDIESLDLQRWNRRKLISTGWRRIIGCLILIYHFPEKRHIISGSCAKNDLQLKPSYGSSPPCMYCMCVLHV